MTQPKKEGATSFPKMFGKRVTSETVESEQRIVSRLLCHYVAGIKRSDLTASGWRNEGDRPGLPPLGIPCKNARPPLTNYANYERSARDTRIFHTGSVHTEEISTPSSSGIQGFSRYCCPLFNVNPDYYRGSLLSIVVPRSERCLAISKRVGIVGAIGKAGSKRGNDFY